MSRVEPSHLVLQEVTVAEWKTSTLLDSYRRKGELLDESGDDSPMVEVTIKCDGHALGSDSGVIKVTDDEIEFRGVLFGFNVSRDVIVDEILDRRFSDEISFDLYHPLRQITVLLRCSSPKRLADLRRAFRSHLDQKAAAGGTVVYPPITPPTSDAVASLFYRLEIIFLIGAIWRFGTLLTTDIYVVILAAAASLCSILALLHESIYAKQPLDNRIDAVALPPVYNALPDIRIIREAHKNPWDLLPPISEEIVAPTDPAIVPPARAVSDVRYLGEDGAVGAASASYAIATERDWIVSLAVLRDKSPSVPEPVAMTDYGVLTFSESAMMFRGINFSFRVGSQFVDQIEAEGILGDKATILPLVHRGRPVWLSFTPSSNQKNKTLLSARLKRFRASGKPDDRRSVYPPLTKFTPMVTKVKLARAVQVLLILGAFGAVLSPYAAVGLVSMIISSVAIRKGLKQEPDARQIPTLVEPPPPTPAASPDKIRVGNTWLNKIE